jgi:hypothetical protein
MPDEQEIYAALNRKDSQELLDVWRTHDTSSWYPEAFNAIKRILDERGVETPEPQPPEIGKAQADAKSRAKRIRFWSRVLTLVPSWILAALIYFPLRKLIFPESESMLGTYALLIIIWQGLTSWVYRILSKERPPSVSTQPASDNDASQTASPHPSQPLCPPSLPRADTSGPRRNRGCFLKGLVITAVVALVLVIGGFVAWHKLVSWGEDFPDQFPLHVAAAQGNLNDIRSLVAQGHDVDQEESFMHSTPLAAAVSANRPEAAALLLELGADPEKKDGKQWAPLHSAVTPQRASCETMEVLLRSGANVDVRDKHLRTPLHRAAQFGKTNAVLLLLKYRADPLAKDENGWTPIDRSIGHIVESARKPGIARILQEAAERRNQ